ncbi:hypothetical protein BDM02DRAFT_3124827 [Thelephora ganbajun]|uniref:Uncharacterized protein n=1 Tax=Thelephora ganbajun TaxID=370292 RepID=A0ACB6YXH1_THEGA|nr:hypothetical protein BDM02DRAFT_3124827 [Thelephora ganbajun]
MATLIAVYRNLPKGFLRLTNGSNTRLREYKPCRGGSFNILANERKAIPGSQAIAFAVPPGSSRSFSTERESPPKSLSFSKINFDDLEEKLNIFPGGTLIIRSDHADRVPGSVAQGGDAYMSSEGMYRHLNLLENLVPRTVGLNEAGTRLWIDTMFFCVSAMLSDEKRMVLNLGQRVPPVSVPMPGQARSLEIAGRIDYTALTMNFHEHHSFITNSLFQFIKRQDPSGLFVTEAKQEEVPLAQQVARAVAEMYAPAKYLKKNVIRGALTNGRDWIFLILYLNEDGGGGTYLQSRPIELQVSSSYPYSVLPPEPDIIAGILAYWMERSFVDLDENDWFYSSNELVAKSVKL